MKAGFHHGLQWAAFMLCGMTMTGCATQPLPPPSPLCEEHEHQQVLFYLQQTLKDKDLKISKLLASKEVMTLEIISLRASQMDSESEINNLRAFQQEQVKELEETTSQAARAEVKLRRLATEADVASHLAEVEVAMAVLQSSLGIERGAPLQVLAQRFLETASASFNRAEYSVAADLAAQAKQLTDMLINNHSLSDTREMTESAFKVAIPLKIKIDSNLRNRPHTESIVIGELNKTTPVVARAYLGQWLRVQTEDGRTGWVSGELLEPR